MTKIKTQVSEKCVQSVLSRFLNPVTAESLSQDVARSLITSEPRPDLLNRLQSKLAVAGITVSPAQMDLWLDRIVCSESVKVVQEKSISQSGLHPAVTKKANQLMQQSLAQGYNIRMIQGWRSFADQEKLYSSNAGVTNARGGESFHNYGLAFDVAFVDDKGNVSFDESHNWQAIGAIGKSLGLKWGGDFHSIKDLGHFEWHPHHSLQEIQQIYQEDGMMGVFQICE